VARTGTSTKGTQDGATGHAVVLTKVHMGGEGRVGASPASWALQDSKERRTRADTCAKNTRTQAVAIPFRFGSRVSDVFFSHNWGDGHFRRLVHSCACNGACISSKQQHQQTSSACASVRMYRCLYKHRTAIKLQSSACACTCKMMSVQASLQQANSLTASAFMDSHRCLYKHHTAIKTKPHRVCLHMQNDVCTGITTAIKSTSLACASVRMYRCLYKHRAAINLRSSACACMRNMMSVQASLQQSNALAATAFMDSHRCLYKHHTAIKTHHDLCIRARVPVLA
jgi:hypothetical protein